MAKGKGPDKGKKGKKTPKDMEYEVGYGRPPKHSQFQKGQSGNPSGRPKEPTTFMESLNKQLSKDVKIIKDGKEYKITGLSAVSQRYVNMVLSGDYKYMKLFLDKTSKDVNIEPYLYPDSSTDCSDDEVQSRSPEYLEALSIIRAQIHKAMSRKLAEGETFNQNKPEKED